MDTQLSIIIPTKDRFKYLRLSVESILNCNLDSFEIIVQDNTADNSEAEQYFGNLNNQNIKYFNIKTWLSVIDNCNQAILNSSGKYVCFIGDDDTIMPYLEKVANSMDINGIDTMQGEKPFYAWPGQRASFLAKEATGTLTYKLLSSKVKNINLRSELRNVLKKGGTKMDDLPCLYHGVVSRSLLDKVYQIANSYFPGPSPDMSNAVALSLLSKKSVKLGIPLIISGKSPSSTGGMGLIHKHIAKIEDVGHLPSNTNPNWTKSIPKYWTGSTIWAESVLKSLDNMGNPDMKAQLNMTYLKARLLVYNYAHRKEIFKDYDLPLFNISFVLNMSKILLERAYFFIKRKFKVNRRIYQGVENIQFASSILLKEMNDASLLTKVLSKIK